MQRLWNLIVNLASLTSLHQWKQQVQSFALHTYIHNGEAWNALSKGRRKGHLVKMVLQILVCSYLNSRFNLAVLWSSLEVSIQHSLNAGAICQRSSLAAMACGNLCDNILRTCNISLYPLLQHSGWSNCVSYISDDSIHNSSPVHLGIDG